MKRFVALCLMAVALATAPAFGGVEEGAVAYGKGDYKTAVAEFQPLAEQGDAKAQYFLGWMYTSGKGVPQDYKRAVKWWKLSAEQGNRDSQLNLGLMYNNGKGVPRDDKEAAKWYRLSAEQGDANAQHHLAIMYGTGHGVLRDDVRAHMWFNLAASNGNEESPEYRDIVAQSMTPAQIDKAQDLASECVAKDYKGC